MSQSQIIWLIVSNLVGKYISFTDGISSGTWIDNSSMQNFNFLNFVISATAWYIWKLRCNVIIFSHDPLDFNSILKKLLPQLRSMQLLLSIKEERISFLLIFPMLMGLSSFLQPFVQETSPLGVLVFILQELIIIFFFSGRMQPYLPNSDVDAEV